MLLAKKRFLLVVGSAILKSLSLIYINYALAWISFAMLFYVIFDSQSTKKILCCGLLFGAISSGLLNFWMIPAVQYYAQGSVLLGLLCWVLSAVILALVYGFQCAFFAKIRFPETNRYALVMNAVLMAALWVLVEWLRAELFSGMPWLNYSVGVSQAGNIFLLQPAAFGSVYILSFFIILANYLIAYAIYKKHWKLLLAPLSIFIIYLSVGFLMYRNITVLTNKAEGPKIKAALVLASLPPETVWDENNGNALVQNLLNLNQQAAQSNPDLILWSETIIPWTYTPNDDFLKVLVKSTAGKKAYSLVGMNTAVDTTTDTIHNSAYLFNPDGRLLGRYDKRELLTLVEKSLFTQANTIILPFLAGSGLQIKPGQHRPALQTPWGKAGILLCNESAGPALTNSYNQSGASYLINLGNDGWFANSFIPRQHFFNGRLRAVEARKDIVINNNRGISGVIRANGDITSRYQLNQSSVQYLDIYPNQIKATSYLPFLYFLICITAVLLSIRLYYHQKIYYPTYLKN